MCKLYLVFKITKKPLQISEPTISDFQLIFNEVFATLITNLFLGLVERKVPADNYGQSPGITLKIWRRLFDVRGCQTVLEWSKLVA